MEIPKYKIALIVGAGAGLSASLARLFSRQDIRVALAARHVEKLGALCTETGARAFACNATEPDEVERLFGLVEREIGVPDVVVYNASGRARGAFTDLVPADVAEAMVVSAFGGFLVAQQAAKRMRWASSRCAALPRAWRANCRRRAFTSRISSSTAAFAAPRALSQPTGRIRCSIPMPLP